MPVIEIILPIKTISEANCRDHWAKKAKRVKTHRTTARLMCPKFELPCIVTLTRVSRGTLDDDNLRGATKAVRDGIADKLGADDGSPLIDWRYAQKKGAPSVMVKLEPMK